MNGNATAAYLTLTITEITYSGSGSGSDSGSGSGSSGSGSSSGFGSGSGSGSDSSSNSDNMSNATLTVMHVIDISVYTSWSLVAPTLLAGAYKLTVDAVDPLNRGVNYAQQQEILFHITSFPVVSMSINPPSVDTLRPVGVKLSAVLSLSACISNPTVIYLWHITNQSGGSLILPSTVRVDMPTLDIPANTFAPGNNYQAQVTAYYAAYPIQSASTGQVLSPLLNIDSLIWRLCAGPNLSRPFSCLS